jgi:4-aminobutyrate aminotransferase / (S)-3-amino-2-methylpropionate transaminase / 5-aminovalerate transaminase
MTDETGTSEVAGSVTGPVPRQRMVVTEIPGPCSLELSRRRVSAVAPGVSSSLPVYVHDGAGAIVRDVDGNCFIDLGSGIAVTGVGHADPSVTAAVVAQAGRFTHTCFMIAPYEEYVAVCEQLGALTPGEHSKRSALFNSGAEAVENAVKVARRATRRQAVVVFDHAYHGRTNLTMALTAKNMPYKDGFGPFAPEVYRAPMSYPLRDPDGMSGEQAAERAIAQIAAQVGAANVACLLIEPIQGEGGFIVPAPGFVPALSAWCADNGVVFVADEVQTGFCRTGAWFASEHEGVVPDLVTTAKGIAAGLPLAGVTGRAELMEAVHPGGLGGTYGGNPVACAAALAAIAVMRDRDLPAAARAIESAVRPRLEAAAKAIPAVAEVRGRGAMLAVELVDPGSGAPDAAAAQSVARHCAAEGVIVLTCGTWGNVLRLLPPLVIEPALLDEGIGIVERALSALGEKEAQ